MYQPSGHWPTLPLSAYPGISDVQSYHKLRNAKTIAAHSSDFLHKRHIQLDLANQLLEMASRAFTSSARALTSTTARFAARRTFQTSAPRLYADAAAPLPARKPMGAFRGGCVWTLFACSSPFLYHWVFSGGICWVEGTKGRTLTPAGNQALRLPPRRHARWFRQLLLHPGGLQSVERAAAGRYLCASMIRGASPVFFLTFPPSSAKPRSRAELTQLLARRPTAWHAGTATVLRKSS